MAKPNFINSATNAERNKVCAAAILRLYSCRAKYTFGSTQTNPPKNADKARSRLTINKTDAMQNVISHCHTSMRCICDGIVNF